MSSTQIQETAPAPPGAMEQLVRDDFARKNFLKIVGKSVGAAGAAASFGAFLAACGSSSKKSTASTPATSTPSTSTSSSAGGVKGDIAILNYALTLEYLETQFYRKVIASGLFSGAPAKLLTKFGSQEAQHVVALKAAVTKFGGTPAPKPKGKFPLKDAASVAKLAATVENLGAAAYLGQAGKIQNKEALAAALAIHSVEARHAAVLNTLVKTSVTPDGAFAKPASMDQVLAAVKPFLAA